MNKLFHSKILMFIVVIAVVVSLSAIPAAASTGSKMAEIFYRNIKITVNGTPYPVKDANGNEVEPFIIDGTTYLPVRGISSVLGFDVAWEDSTSTIKLSYGEDLYYIVRVSEMYDEFFALYNNMYWLSEQMNHLNTRILNKENNTNFASAYSLLDEWILEEGHIDLIIQGTEDILNDVKSSPAKSAWLDSEIKSSDDMLSQTKRIYSILLEMHAQNSQCHEGKDVFKEFGENYRLSIELLAALNKVAREGQLAANEYLRANIG